MLTALGTCPVGGPGVPVAGTAGQRKAARTGEGTGAGYDEASMADSFVVLNAVGGRVYRGLWPSTRG